jgi:hypothetical protein
VIPVYGAFAVGTDVLGGLLVAGWVAGLVRGGADAAGAGDGMAGWDGAVPRWAWPIIAFSAWVALSAAWGEHPGYAMVKGVGFLGLILTALALRGSRLDWRELADAWLLGCVLVLVATVLGLTLGGEWGRDRLLYYGGSVEGLPLARLQGPFLHPNLLADYLVMSGVLLWARWPDLKARFGKGPMLLLAVAMWMAAELTVGSAWLGAGAAIMVIAAMGRGGQIRTDGVDLQEPRPTYDPVHDDPVEFSMAADSLSMGRAAAFLGGIAIVMVASYGLFFGGVFALGDLVIHSPAIRAAIVASAMMAFYSSPLIGVGAAPYLAAVGDPADTGPAATGDLVLWDAHNTYVSVAGQFGIIGFALLFGGIFLLTRQILKSPPSTARTLGFLMLLVPLVNSLAIAGEEIRWWWAGLGIAGVVAIRTEEAE